MGLPFLLIQTWLLVKSQTKIRTLFKQSPTQLVQAKIILTCWSMSRCLLVNFLLQPLLELFCTEPYMAFGWITTTLSSEEICPTWWLLLWSRTDVVSNWSTLNKSNYVPCHLSRFLKSNKLEMMILANMFGIGWGRLQMKLMNILSMTLLPLIVAGKSGCCPFPSRLPWCIDPIDLLIDIIVVKLPSFFQVCDLLN